MARPFQDCVVLLGDSLTNNQHVPNNLQARFSSVYARSLDVLNRDFGSYNTVWFLPVMERIFAKKDEAANCPKVRLITLWLGVNDSALPAPHEKKTVPLEVFRRNIEKILDLLTAESSPYAVAHDTHPLSIILITPPAINDAMRAEREFPGVSNDHTRKYRDAVLQVGAQWKKKQEGKRWKVGTVDLFGSLEKACESGDPRRFYLDGVHLTTAGYDVLWAEIDKLVHSDFRGRGIDWNDPDDLPWTEPDARTGCFPKYGED